MFIKALLLQVALLPGALLGSPVVLDFDPSAALYEVGPQYVSVNIDSASLAQGMDFSDAKLATLLRQLGSVQLRVGGTSSHGLVWTGAPGLPCGCCGPKRSQIQTWNQAVTGMSWSV